MPLPSWIASDARVEANGSHAASWSASELAGRVDEYAAMISEACGEGAVVGLAADNSPEWIAADLAAQAAGADLVPLPGFFSNEQVAHAVRASAMEAVFSADAMYAASLGFTDEVFARPGLSLFRSAARKHPQRSPSSESHKITFTSGTTQAPRGVILTTAQQLCTAQSLASVAATIGIRRHLCALPLSVLLENVAGVYTSLMLGATCLCPSLEDLGISGASGFDAERFLEAIAYDEPDSLILLPQMLQSLLPRLARGTNMDARLRSLKFVSVGGAKTPPALIAAARQLGMPVYEGYGLTECASVVSVNLPGADRIGTVGRPLPGVAVRTTRHGELEVAGRPCAGYLALPGDESQAWFATGDLGTIDSDGYISITGRKKNVLVTSFARNISPEWPESLLLEDPLIVQAAVFGDAHPFLVALLVPASPETEDTALERAVQHANSKLPEYARIRCWVRACQPFTALNGLATANGRIRRAAVAERYAAPLNALYEYARQPLEIHDHAGTAPLVKHCS